MPGHKGAQGTVASEEKLVRGAQAGVLRLAARGEHQDRQVGLRAQIRSEIEAVFARHHHVEDQAVEVDALDQGARLGGVGRSRDEEPLLGEEAVQEASEPRIVVDDQEMSAIGCVHRFDDRTNNLCLTGFSAVMLTSIGCRFRPSKLVFRGFPWPK